MPGLFNARNLAMAMLSASLVQSFDREKQSVFENPFLGTKEIDYSNCRGVKRRQEVLLDQENLLVLSDFAHHPTAISGALESLRSRWPDRKIIACFEPRSNTAVTNVFQDRFAESLALADHALIGQVHRVERIAPEKRIDTQEIVKFIKAKGRLANAFESNRKMGDFLRDEFDSASKLKSMVVFFSNGSFDGVIQEFVEVVRN